MAEAPAHAWGVPQLDVAPARLEERAAASKFACLATTRCAIARSAPPTNKGWLPRAEHFERLGWVKHGSGEARASKSASLEHPSCLRTGFENRLLNPQSGTVLSKTVMCTPATKSDSTLSSRSPAPRTPGSVTSSVRLDPSPLTSSPSRRDAPISKSSALACWNMSGEAMG